MSNLQYQLTPYAYSMGSQLVNIVNYLQQEKDDETIELLKFCTTTRTEREILTKFSAECYHNAKYHWYIADTAKMFTIHHYDTVEIETTNYCNYHCNYCPVKYQPAATKKVMDRNLFTKIIQEAAANGVKYVALHFYNEPTLDPYFEERIVEISKTNLKLTLYTNASGLNHSKLLWLEKYASNVKSIHINLPSLDPMEFRRMTGTPLTKSLLDNIDRILHSRFGTEIIINGTKAEIKRNIGSFLELGCPLNHTGSNDRAGILKNEYKQDIHIREPLCGCARLLHTMNVLVDGSVVFCCNDYERKHVIGNFKKDTFLEIINSEKTITYKKIIFGWQDGNLICHRCSFMEFMLLNHKHVPLIKMFANQSALRSVENPY